MYLSLLKLNPQSRRAMTEALRPYELHRSLMAAFPHNASGGYGHVLFRLDIDRETGGMSVLVQSGKEPNWASLNSATKFVTEYQSKPFDPVFTKGKMLRFRLRANPTRRVNETGKRQGILGEEAQMEWLSRKGEKSGFEVVDVSVYDEGFAKDNMTKKEAKHSLTMISVRFDGLIRVTNPDAFRQTIEQGIGSGKGLGFGLMSIAPYRD